jgi:isoleucyl-tRNA synthetase
VVTAALEVQRRDKVIGASLEAAPLVQVADPDLAKVLKTVPMDDICITSGLTVMAAEPQADAFRLDDPGIGVVFHAAQGEKCQRCWKILPDVGSHAHPGVCARCNTALGG